MLRAPAHPDGMGHTRSILTLSGSMPSIVAAIAFSTATVTAESVNSVLHFSPVGQSLSFLQALCGYRDELALLFRARELVLV